MMAQMIDSVDMAEPTPDMSPAHVHLGRRGAARELHDRWLETFGVEVLDGIGSSELYHIYISNRPGRVRPGSTGELVPGYAAELGENGELLVTGDTAALLYWGDDEKTKATFSGDTVRTGDLFERDEDGFFWYRGRVDDLIKVGGIWVAPGRDRALPRRASGRRSSARSSASSRTASPCRGAYVVARRAARGAGPAGLRPRATLAAQVPARVEFVDDLPKTPSGKIDRKALRA